MPILNIPEKFIPFTYPHRWKVSYGGRGGGKSWTIADILIAIATDRPTRILCAREFQSSIDESVKKLLDDRIDVCGARPSVVTSKKAPKIEFINGSEIIFEGLKYNVNRIKSMEGIDICWVEEADVVSDFSWRILIPTIRKTGSEIWVSFNPRQATDAAYRRFVLNKPTDSVIVNVNWRDNPWDTDVLKQEREDLKAMDYEEYMHVYEGQLREFAEGAIYAQQLRELKNTPNRYTRLPVTGNEVHTFWDLGKDDATSIWFMQQNGPWCDFLHYYENNFEDIPFYAEAVKEIANERGFNLGYHFMPHDVEQDIFGMEMTRKKQFEAAGIKPIRVVPRITDLQEGIMMTKRKFKMCRFDEEHAADGWNCLTNYRRNKNEDTGKYTDQPVHDWASHGSDSFRQFGQGYRVGFREDIEADRPKSERRRDAVRRNQRRKRDGGMSQRV